jgi:hypothetical protein
MPSINATTTSNRTRNKPMFNTASFGQHIKWKEQEYQNYDEESFFHLCNPQPPTCKKDSVLRIGTDLLSQC